MGGVFGSFRGVVIGWTWVVFGSGGWGAGGADERESGAEEQGFGEVERG